MQMALLQMSIPSSWKSGDCPDSLKHTFIHHKDPCQIKDPFTQSHLITRDLYKNFLVRITQALPKREIIAESWMASTATFQVL